MRTTLSIDDDVFTAVKQYAEARSLGLSEAASQLLRRGISLPTPTKRVNGLLVFDLSPGLPAITSERVRELESEL